MLRSLTALAPLMAAPLLAIASPAMAATDPAVPSIPATAAAVAQDPIHGVTPEEVRAWLVSKGATVPEPRTIDGQTLLQVNDGSTNWLIFFYGCDATGRCQDIQFAANVVAQGITIERINAWNRTQRFGKAYLQPNADGTQMAVLQYDVLLMQGLDVEQINDPTVVWLDMLAKFIEHLVTQPAS